MAPQARQIDGSGTGDAGSAAAVAAPDLSIDAEGPQYEAHPRFDRSRLGTAIDWMRRTPLFQLVPGLNGPEADEIGAGVLNKLSDLRWPCCVNGCAHQCVICSNSSGAHVQMVRWDDYLYLLECLRSLKETARLRFSFGLYDVAPHFDGDTLTYYGYDRRRRPAYSAYDILCALVQSDLFQTPEKPGRNRLQIFTSGFYDPAHSDVITAGIRRIVMDSETILGRDPYTGETGRIVVSFSNATRYFHEGDGRLQWWRDRLVHMFSILRPLVARRQLGLSVKYAPPGTADERLERMTLDRILCEASSILQAAGYRNVEALLQEPGFVFVQQIYAQGRAAGLPVSLSLQQYVAQQYPPDFSTLRLGTLREGVVRVDGSYDLMSIKMIQPKVDSRIRAFRLWFPSLNEAAHGLSQTGRRPPTSDFRPLTEMTRSEV